YVRVGTCACYRMDSVYRGGFIHIDAASFMEQIIPETHRCSLIASAPAARAAARSPPARLLPHRALEHPGAEMTLQEQVHDHHRQGHDHCGGRQQARGMHVLALVERHTHHTART